MTFSDIGINSIEYVPLQAIDSSIVYSTSKISISKRFIIVEDNISETIYAFSRSGKYLFKYSAKDSIATKRIRICYQSSSSSHIGILTEPQKRLLLFDSLGQVLNQYPIHYHANEIIITSDAERILFYPKPLNYFNQGYSFTVLNGTELTKKFFNQNFEIVKKDNSITYYSINVIEDTISYWEYYNDRIIYFGSDKEGKVKYRLDMGANKLDYTKIDSPANLYAMLLKTNAISNLIDSKKYIYFEVVSFGKIYFLFYNKTTQALISLDFPDRSTIPSIIDNLNHSLVFRPFGATSSGELFSVDDLSKMISVKDSAIMELIAKGRIDINRRIQNPVIRIIK